jgi:hypothetical protein
MAELDFDPSSLRDWLAGAGLLRILSDMTQGGRMQWRLERGRYRLFVIDAARDLPQKCVAWVERNRDAWQFGGFANANFSAEEWQQHAVNANGLEQTLWCALASDAVMHRDGKKLQASRLEYGHGGGHQHWLGSMRQFLSGAVDASDFARILEGRRDEAMKGSICRWDPACERDHAYRAKDPSNDPMAQDQTINLLAAVGLASCPSAPSGKILLTPLVFRRTLRWPLWTDALRIADLEASLCCEWTWPTMVARRWTSDKLYCFSRGVLREPEASTAFPEGSRRAEAVDGP